MKKKMLVGLVMGLALFMGGCGNRDMIDTVRTYDYAIMQMPDGRIVEGDVQSWRDYEGDVLQVKIDDITYYVHSENIVLMHGVK